MFKINLIVRVFREKLGALKKDLIEYGVLGQVIAHIDVIEFQKRGLPHTHLLIILHPDDKPMSPDNYDEIVQTKILDSVSNSRKYATITANMIHGVIPLFISH